MRWWRLQVRGERHVIEQQQHDDRQTDRQVLTVLNEWKRTDRQTEGLWLAAAPRGKEEWNLSAYVSSGVLFVCQIKFFHSIHTIRGPHRTTRHDVTLMLPRRMFPLPLQSHTT
mmetsp:Transcript_14998/g.35739  ORF Transcript_14998/g.35739 Transcript_14998/m.35739 type:complete len:113 (-) Transcript_14998:374-712(-)